ncbi:MAG: rod shape-determining protein RodA [Pseudoduganella sp.]|jgi:hypothetical protein|nr:rod shape-determining protein RodA [Pseudoduganella sp.]
MKKFVAAIAMALVAGGAAAQSVDFTEPKNGAVVSSPFKVKFAVTGMAVKPAGDISDNTGHHHLIINGDSMKVGESIPFDEKHLHFGKGQTETDVTLPPGTYKLTMQFANGAHQSYGPGLAKSITVTVK